MIGKRISIQRRLPVGAEIAGGGVHFRVWAPVREAVDVVIGSDALPLDPEPAGYFSGFVAAARAGSRYRFRLDGGDAFPDPASRFQPDGPHGESQVVDPFQFEWTDREWRGVGSKRHIIYEMHVGTFTSGGSWAAAAERLPELAGLGITLLEIMPVAEFPGRFGWGYDGVDLFAPYHHYGTCDDFRAFVNRAHEEGIGVILDVVYNHIGPDGNYLPRYSDSYFSEKHVTEWGNAINYDGDGSAGVRELVLSNARHWISEYHLDGFRLDATQSVFDDSPRHILAEIRAVTRDAAGARDTILVAEDERQEARLLRDPGAGGFGIEMVWNDDFHHSAVVAATGRREAYYSDHRGLPQEFISAAKHGFLFQGQRYEWQDQRRGTPTIGVAPHRFVHFIENHDQVANSRDGNRLHKVTGPGRYRALTALLLLGPQTPMLFQGQEFGASAPFLFFADHNPGLAELVRKGRDEFLRQFVSIAGGATRPTSADPADERTFERCRLDQEERLRHAEMYALHRDLIALRQCDPVLSGGFARIDGAVLGASTFLLRYLTADRNDRLLIVNLGADYPLTSVPEPLLAPPVQGRAWTELWSSEDPCYGGRGAAPIEAEDGSWRFAAESATLLAIDPE